MSPLPNRPLQPPKSYAAESAAASSADTPENTTSTEPTAQRPLMRPVARPQPPAPEAPAPVTQASEPADSAPAASASSEPSEEALAEMRQQPIPAPSEPMQYRAIGLLRGRYKPTDEQFTRGEMITSDGTMIEAVLLGRVMSLVKNHLDLEQDHLWVVYPRTREKQEDLHVQIVGVWEPEKLSKPDDEAEEQESPGYLPSSEVEDNYFSIRGEIIFHAPESQSLIVKIQQAPRKKDDRAKMFKLKLNGVLTGKTIGYFWELNVRREGANLVVQDGRSIGMIPPKKRPKGAAGERSGPGRGGRFGDKKPFRPRPGGSSGGGRPYSAPPQPQQQRRGEPLPKPVKRKAAPEDSPPETNVTNEA